MTADLTRFELEELSDAAWPYGMKTAEKFPDAITQLLAQLDAANANFAELGKLCYRTQEAPDAADARADAAAEQMRAQCVEMATSQAILTRHQMKASFLTTTTSYLLDRQRSLTAYKIADDIAALQTRSQQQS